MGGLLLKLVVRIKDSQAALNEDSHLQQVWRIKVQCKEKVF